jgi:hypothetical protein
MGAGSSANPTDSSIITPSWPAPLDIDVECKKPVACTLRDEGSFWDLKFDGITDQCIRTIEDRMRSQLPRTSTGAPDETLSPCHCVGNRYVNLCDNSGMRIHFVVMFKVVYQCFMRIPKLTATAQFNQAQFLAVLERYITSADIRKLRQLHPSTSEDERTIDAMSQKGRL